MPRLFELVGSRFFLNWLSEIKIGRQSRSANKVQSFRAPLTSASNRRYPNLLIQKIPLVYVIFGAFFAGPTLLLASESVTVRKSPIGQETISIIVGSKRSFPTVTDVWIEDKTIVKAEVIGEILYLRGLKPGTTPVRLNDSHYDVVVTAIQSQKTFNQLSQVVKRTLGLRLAYERETAVVRGKLLRWEDWQILADHCRHATCAYSMRAEIPPQKQREFQQEFFRMFKAHNLPQERVEFEPEARVQLAKWVASVANDAKGGTDGGPEKTQRDLMDPERLLYKRFAKILTPYGVSIEEDAKGVGLEPLIRVNITVAEVRRDKTQQYGIKWPGSYQARLLPSMKFEKNQGAEFDIQALETRGEGRVLASPNILTRSGSTADYLAGGEFPIVVKTLKMQSVEWKKYGVLLKTLPRADRNGRMSIAVEIEVSSIDPSRTIEGIPALYTHRMKNHFDLAESRTIALSGMIKREEAENTQGLPFLSRIPILGSLFGSKDFRDNRSEFVIFVRPEIVAEHDADTDFDAHKFIQ